MTNKGDEIVTLTVAEKEVVRRAAKVQGSSFDTSKANYTIGELSELGVVRESYLLSEASKKGLIHDGVVSSFGEEAARAEEELVVEAPFASGIKKWQLPINASRLRMLVTKFPPKSVVKRHYHPKSDDPGGGLRIVLKGSINFEGNVYAAGDWFFVPNGTPYEFTTDEDVETQEAYAYDHFVYPRSHAVSDDLENRFSGPKES